MKESLKGLLDRLPYIRKLHSELKLYKKDSFFPPGHFYSPIVNVDEIRAREHEVWSGESVDHIDGINLRVQDQIELVQSFKRFYDEIPFASEKEKDVRYYFNNGFYSYTDAIFLYSMIRKYAPKRIIEIGCGFSSSVMLDTNEFFFNSEITLTFIEPYPERLNSLLKKSDYKSTRIIERPVQEVPLEVFTQLGSGDILFVDSTHVSKTGSDVNYILFDILPQLGEGVLIHFHDVFHPFEYPRSWVYMGRNWNEDYLLRAFLMYNNVFDIKLFSHYLHTHHGGVFDDMPLCYRNFGGNLWLEKNKKDLT